MLISSKGVTWQNDDVKLSTIFFKRDCEHALPYIQEHKAEHA